MLSSIFYLMCVVRVLGSLDSEILDYSASTVRRLHEAPSCRAAFGPLPSSRTQAVATASDAFSPNHLKDKTNAACRCSEESSPGGRLLASNAPTAPEVSTLASEPLAGSYNCRLTFRLPCDRIDGMAPCKVDELWLSSIPKVGSQSMQRTAQALSMDKSIKGWQPPRGPCWPDDPERTRSRFIVVREPFEKFISAFFEIAGGSIANVGWKPWRAALGCDISAPRNATEVLHTFIPKTVRHLDRDNILALINEFMKNVAAGFVNFHVVSQSTYIFNALRLPDFVAKLQDAKPAWRLFADANGCNGTRCRTYLADHVTPLQKPAGKRPNRPTLGDLDTEAQAAFCAYFKQDYACLGYEIPPECNEDATRAWPHPCCEWERKKLFSSFLFEHRNPGD